MLCLNLLICSFQCFLFVSCCSSYNHTTHNLTLNHKYLQYFEGSLAPGASTRAGKAFDDRAFDDMHATKFDVSEIRAYALSSKTPDTYVYMYMRVYIYIYIHITHIFMYMIYVYVCIYVYIYMCVYIYIYIYICIYTYLLV